MRHPEASSDYVMSWICFRNVINLFASLLTYHHGLSYHIKGFALLLSQNQSQSIILNK